MLSRILSYALDGIDGYRVEVETDISAGLTKTDIVGMGDTAIKEARDRINAAILNSGYSYPYAKIVISLAPADIKKEGAGFDLAMSIGILAAAGVIHSEMIEDTVIIGELGLGGEVRGVSGILPIMIAAVGSGIKRFIIPEANCSEASYCGGAEVYGVSNLCQAVKLLVGEEQLEAVEQKQYTIDGSQKYIADFKYVKGQIEARRAMEVAASGGHNIMMIGPAGSGKTMLSKCLPSIMPQLTKEEALEVTKIHSVAGVLDRQMGVVKVPPFRTPHHTATTVALTGGGSRSKPGEISLAHNGILFLDEMPEYSRGTLETLRQPLEDGVITIARAARTVTYPSRFMLIASMNPCPCGNYGSKTKPCKCTKSQIDKYLSKLSGPLLDRIDLHIGVDSVTYDDINSSEYSESSETIRGRVIEARNIQRERYNGTGITCNANMGQAELNKYCKLSDDCKVVLRRAFEQFKLSARAYSRILKVARTIADLAKREDIIKSDIIEAVGYRALDRER